MSPLEYLSGWVGSRKFANDLLEGRALTYPWWLPDGALQELLQSLEASIAEREQVILIPRNLETEK